MEMVIVRLDEWWVEVEMEKIRPWLKMLFEVAVPGASQTCELILIGSHRPSR